jgi:hypothetical protein
MKGPCMLPNYRRLGHRQQEELQSDKVLIVALHILGETSGTAISQIAGPPLEPRTAA